MDISSGIRVMQTFRKLPITIPNRKKKAMTTFRLSHTRRTPSTNAAVTRAPSLTLSSFL
jgi:hypothetical protein